MSPAPVLVVVGVGGAGVNAVNHLAEIALPEVRYVAADASAQSLAAVEHHGARVERVLLAEGTRGLGTGGDAALGERAARGGAQALAARLGDAPLVAVVAGLGGGTGGGGAPVVAEIARLRGGLTVGFGILPFPFEPARVGATAARARGALAERCHALIALDNARLLAAHGRSAPIEVALRAADETVRQAVEGLVALAGARRGPAERRWLDCDLARVRGLLRGGEARLGLGFAAGGEEPVRRALREAMTAADGRAAEGVLVHVTGGDDLAVADVERVAVEARGAWAPDGALDVGVTAFPGWRGVARVMVLALGLRAAVAAAPVDPALPLRRAV